MGTNNAINANATTPLASLNGGTGVSNASTITLAGALVTSGANSLTLTTTGPTNVTLPTSGTLATTAQIPSTPVSIANGGTNAASFTQSAGVVVYNGTSLVNYAGPQIDSSGRATNTAQPAFMSFLSTPSSNQTGDGTAYTIIFDSTNFNTGTVYNTGTGVFTAPVAGRYFLFAQCLLSDIGVGHTGCTFDIVSTTGTYSTSTLFHGSDLNPATCRDLSSNPNDLIVTVQGMILFAANDACKAVITVTGSTKTIDIFGAASPNFYTSFGGYLVC